MWSGSLYDQPFSRQKKFVENRKKRRKYTEWPQIVLDHLTFKTDLYILSTYQGASIFGPFCSTASILKMQRCLKSDKSAEWPQMTLKINIRKYHVYTKRLTPKPQFQPFWQDLLLFYIDHHVTRPKEPKMSKIQNLKFPYSFNKLICTCEWDVVWNV